MGDGEPTPRGDVSFHPAGPVNCHPLANCACIPINLHAGFAEFVLHCAIAPRMGNFRLACRQGRLSSVWRSKNTEISKMKRASAISLVASLGLTFILLSSAGTAVAETSAPPEAPATLNAVDF